MYDIACFSVGCVVFVLLLASPCICLLLLILDHLLIHFGTCWEQVGSICHLFVCSFEARPKATGHDEHMLD